MLVYEYGPFGEPLRVSGAMAGMNPFRFSTKEVIGVKVIGVRSQHDTFRAGPRLGR